MAQRTTAIMPMSPEHNAGSASPSPAYRYDVFISYSEADQAWVWGWLIPRLKAANLTICTDRESFDVGVPIVQNRENAVTYSRHTLLVLTPSWMASEWGYFDALVAQYRDPTARHRRVLPVLREPCDLPLHLKHLTYADLSGVEVDEIAFTRLLDALHDRSFFQDTAPSGIKQPKAFVPLDAETPASKLLRHVPRTYRAQVLRMIEDYEAVFGGRDAELAALDTFLAQSEQPCALLLAPTGRGKTALLIHWLLRIQAQGDWTVVFAPISRRYQIATAKETLEALAQPLATFHGEAERLQTYNQSPDQLRPLVAEYLRRDPPAGRRLLLVLDGLDEAVSWSVSRDLFPRTFGPSVRVVVSARQMAHQTYADWLDTLGWRAKYTYAPGLVPLSRNAVAEILRSMGNPLDALATNVDFLTEIGRISQGDPLTIRMLVEALKDGELTPDRLTSMPPGLESFVRDWLDEIEQESSRKPAIHALLGLCAIALGPLTAEDLKHLDKTHFPIRAVLNQAAKAVARFIIGDGSTQSGYVFSHPRLRELFVEEILSNDERTQLQQQFVAYGLDWYADRSTPLPTYLRQFWIAHLTEAREWTHARRILTEVVPIKEHSQQPWAEARYGAEGSYTGYLGDLDMLRQYADAHHDSGLGIRCALIVASIRSLSGNLSPALLAGLVKVGTPEGKWSPVAAVEHIRQMPDAQRQAAGLEALLQCGCDLSYGQVLEVVRLIADDDARVQALESLAPKLPPEFLLDALAVARALADDGARVWALRTLAPHLLADQQAVVYRDALVAARVIMYDGARIEALQALVPELPPECLPDALAIIYVLTDDGARVRAFKVLAPHLPPKYLPGALAAAHALANDGARVQALQALAPYLPPDQQVAVYRDALVVAHAIANNNTRVEALQALAPHLPSDQQAVVYRDLLAIIRVQAHDGVWARALQALAPKLPPECLPDALAIARAIADDDMRVRTLYALAPHLSLDQQVVIYRDALAVVRAIANNYTRARTLYALAWHLPSDQQAVVYRDLLAIIRVQAHDGARVQALQALAPKLPPECLPDALVVARAIADDDARVKALQALAPHLPSDQQAVVYRDLLAIIRVQAHDGARVQALQALVPKLPPECLPDALALVRVIANDGARVQALQALAPHLPPDQQVVIYRDALAVARAIADNNVRVRILEWLAPHLPSECLLDALAVARAITDDNARTRTLYALAPHLPPDQQAVIYHDELAVARAITDNNARVEALQALAPHLPSKCLLDALAVICALVDDESRVGVLQALAPYLPPDQQVVAYRDALAVAHALADDDARARALQALAPHLPSECLLDALAVIPALADDNARVEVLQMFAPHLPPDQQVVIYRDVLAIVHKTADNVRVRMLEWLTPHLPSECLLDALVLARAITDDDARVQALQALAPHLPPDQQAVVYRDALAVARAITDDNARAWALEALAPHLPPNQQVVAYRDVLAVARTIASDKAQVRMLESLAPHLPSECLFDALAVARAITDDSARVRALQALAPHLPPDQQAVVYRDALAVARAITDDSARVRALQALAPHLPPNQQVVVYRDVLAVARTIASDSAQVRMLESLAPHLPSECLFDALAVARAITDDSARVQALQALAPHLPPDQQAVVYHDGLVAARAIAYHDTRVQALQALAPHLTLDQQAVVYRDALAVARAIADDSWRAKVLHALAPHLAADAAGHLAYHLALWQTTTRQLAGYGRPGFLSSLAALMPWFVALTTPEMRADVVTAIADVSRCWP